jgi:cell division protein FtsX
MKLLRRLLYFVLFLGLIGYGVYYFGTNFASNKMMDYVSTELETSGEVESIKQQIAANPEIQAFLKEGTENVDENTLVYKTKEEATRGVVKKLGIKQVMDIQSKVSDGVTAEEKSEILNQLESELSQEEILALKVLAYKELNQ